MNFRIVTGDCLVVLKGMACASVDAIVTDPPAGISFMGKAWDGDKGGRKQWVAWLTSVMAEAHRVLKPGGHALVWALPRTSHWTALALEEGGFEIRDSLHHVFGTGFPKSLNVSKAIDKAAGAKREVVGVNPNHRPVSGVNYHGVYAGANTGAPDLTAPATPAAQQWEGFGTALKPAHEVWWLARKPFRGTVAKNVLEHGTGALNVDGCRVATSDDRSRANSGSKGGAGAIHTSATYTNESHTQGRWPANLLLSHDPECSEQCVEGCAVAAMDAQSGVSKSTANRGTDWRVNVGRSIFIDGRHDAQNTYSDKGGASRFFPCFRYQAKPSTKERDAGLDGCEIVVTLDPQFLSKGASEWKDISTTPEERKVTLRVDMGTSLPRVIAASGLPKRSATEWNTLLFGSKHTALYQRVIKSTTSTARNSTTASTISKYLQLLLTSDSTAVARLEKAFGLSRAESAVLCKTYRPVTTEGKTASRQRVRPVPLHAPLTITVEGARNIHSTVKSIELMRWLVRLVTPPGGTVLDMFAGSGSTGVACALEGASFVGIEKNPDYAEMARQRIAHATRLAP